MIAAGYTVKIEASEAGKKLSQVLQDMARTYVTDGTTSFERRVGHKILAQNIKIVWYARVGWNTSTLLVMIIVLVGLVTPLARCPRLLRRRSNK